MYKELILSQGKEERKMRVFQWKMPGKWEGKVKKRATCCPTVIFVRFRRVFFKLGFFTFNSLNVN